MLTALLILFGDLAIGAAAWRLSRSNEKGQAGIQKVLENQQAMLANHEERITTLERTDKTEKAG